jgi:competence protein ComEC
VGGSSRLSEKTLSYIKTACIGKPGKLFISHFDLDHIRNARQLLKTVTIQKAFFSHLDPKTKYAKSLLTDLSFAKVEILQIDSRFFLKENGFSLKCLWPESGFDHYRIENDHSLVLLLKVNGRSVLFTGDLPERIEPFLQNTNIEILKVGHHGSKTSSSLAFLKNLRPKVCVVSVGAENHYGHPTHEALTRFKQTHCAILRTDRLGSVSFEL